MLINNVFWATSWQFFFEFFSISRNFVRYYLRAKFQINWRIQTEITEGGGAESALPQPYQSAKSLACLGLSYVSVQNTIRCLCWAGELSSLHDVESDKSTGWVLGIHEAKKNFSLYMVDF